MICFLWKSRRETERTEQYCKKTCSLCSISVSDKTENAVGAGELSLGTAMLGRKEAEMKHHQQGWISFSHGKSCLWNPVSPGAIIQTTPAPNDMQQIVKQLSSYGQMLLKQKSKMAVPAWLFYAFQWFRQEHELLMSLIQNWSTERFPKNKGSKEREHILLDWQRFIP